MLSRETVTELSALSKEVFGSTSHYRKLMDKGERILVTEETTVVEPGKDGEEDTTKTIKVPVYHTGKRQNNAKMLKYTLVHHTAESVKARMLEIKAEQARIKELLEKMQAEQKAKEEEKKKAQVMEEVSKISGSVR